MSHVNFTGETFNGTANISMAKSPFGEGWRVQVEQDESEVEIDQGESHLFYFDAVSEQEGNAKLSALEAIGEDITEEELEELGFEYMG